MLAVEVDNAAGVNPFPTLWAAAVREAGVEVVQYSPRSALRRRFDVFHVHWPESLFGRVGRSPRRLASSLGHLMVLGLLRARGVRIIWTAHNITPNSRRVDPLSDLCLRVFRTLVDEVWTLSAAGSQSVRDRLGLRVAIVEMKHPVYPVDQSLVNAVVARAGLVMSFGEVRPYRGFAELVEAFKQLPDEALSLLIVGARRSDAYSERLAQSLRSARRVEWDARRLSDEQLQRSILAAEIVCLPYVEVTNSGAALLALSLGRPVLVPDFPVFQELRDEVGSAWVGLMSGDLELDIRELRQGLRTAPPRLGARTWDSFGEGVRQACERLRPA